MKTLYKGQDALALLSSIYAAIACAMNIFCMKPLSFGSNIIICDGGLIISWGVFLLSNVIVEVWGEETSLKVIFSGTIISFFILTLGRLIVLIPTLGEYTEQASAFALIFSNGIRTILASVIAFFVGNTLNVKIIAKIKNRIKKDNKVKFFLRAAISTLFGQLCDNALFMTLAFFPVGLSLYEMNIPDIISSVLSGTVIETVLEATLVPIITIPLVNKMNKIKERG